MKVIYEVVISLGLRGERPKVINIAITLRIDYIFQCRNNSAPTELRELSRIKFYEVSVMPLLLLPSLEHTISNMRAL